MRHTGFLRKLGPLLTCVGVTCLTSLVFAQTRVPENNGEGMDTHLFRPALDSKGFFTVNGADVLGANDVSFGLVMDYGRNLMRLSDGHGAEQLVAHSFQGTFGFNYGLFNFASIGLSAPANLMSGNEATGIGPLGSEYDSGQLDVQNFSYVALHTKLRLLRPHRGFGAALALQGGIPTSENVSRELGADPSPWFWPRVILESRLGRGGPFRIGADAGYRFHNGKNPRFDQLEEGPLEYGNLITGGIGVSYRAMEVLDLIGETYMTHLLSDQSDSKQKLSAEAVGGIKLFAEHRSFLMMGAGTRYTPGFQAADLRMFIGFVFEPTILDRDGDRVKERPEPTPEDLGYGDRDGDGILDKYDLCPDEPEDFDGFEDEDGCPDLDNDGDGIPDTLDKCPNDPEDFDGFEDGDGCPELDNDQDGITDALDHCPNEPETYNNFEDEDGCPDVGKVVVEENEILIMEQIMFETNSANIQPQSFELLDSIATTLKHNPEFLLVEVGGHADERGTDEHNLRLTRDRANSVRQALIERNIEADRLKAVGYGEFCPIDARSTQEAWDKNRRVEFKILKTDEGDTGVATGCERAREKGIR